MTAPPVVTSNKPYVGRFAPSPTGALHLGSLLTATASFLQARTQKGKWLLRIEDIDPPRELPWSVNSILKTLEQYGFNWDGEILYQSKRISAYLDALKLLKKKGHTYYCTCSRKQIESISKPGPYGHVYPGKCRRPGISKNSRSSVRLLTDDSPVGFSDRLYGQQTQRLESQVGDFVIRRADGYIAYLLAVSVDDLYQGITEIVRGVDLLSVTPRQIYLQRLLDERSELPEFFHLPIIVNQQGEKLSKQTHAAPLPADRPVETLIRVMRMLGHNPPAEAVSGNLTDFWSWAMQNWNISKIPIAHKITAPALPANEPPITGEKDQIGE